LRKSDVVIERRQIIKTGCLHRWSNAMLLSRNPERKDPYSSAEVAQRLRALSKCRRLAEHKIR
jgi:hypothetical protein